MNGDELEPAANPPALSLVDRELMTRDLERAAGYLTPIMLANLETLKTWRPVLKLGPLRKEVPAGELVYDRLKGYLPQMISGALGGLTTLQDGELVGLASVVSAELGAWCRQREPLTGDQMQLAAPAMAHLLGTADARPPVDWSGLEPEPGE